MKKAAGSDRRPLRVRCNAALSGADLSEEVGDLMAERLALALQGVRRVLDVLGGSGGRIGIAFDTSDILRDVLGSLRRKLRRAGDLLGRSALFLHGSRDRGCDFVDLADDRADALDRVDGLAGDLLDVGDLVRDLLGRLRGLACE